MFKNFDWLIVLAVLFIFSLGVLVLYSVAPEFARHQLIYFILGFVFFCLISHFDYSFFEGLPLILYVFSFFSLLSPFFLGTVTRGASRWITLGPLTLQPSEGVKPLFILIFASLANRLDLSKIKNLFLLFLIFFPLGFLVFSQPSLGSTLVVFTIFLAIVFTAGVKLAHFLVVLLTGSSLMPLVWRFLAIYQKRRLLSFLDPWQDPLGSGYHLIQSKIAVGSGLIFGKGLGQGTQSHLRFLPEFQSDFIFAALAEELGLIGSFLLMAGYFFLLWRILKIAAESQNRFGSLVAVGVFAMLFFQTAVNMGMNLGLLPVTGVTLPLVSSGGSSLITTLVSLGLVKSIVRVEKERI